MDEWGSGPIVARKMMRCISINAYHTPAPRRDPLESDPLIEVSLSLDYLDSIITADGFLRDPKPDVNVGTWTVIVRVEIVGKLRRRGRQYNGHPGSATAMDDSQ